MKYTLPTLFTLVAMSLGAFAAPSNATLEGRNLVSYNIPLSSPEKCSDTLVCCKFSHEHQHHKHPHHNRPHHKDTCQETKEPTCGSSFEDGPHCCKFTTVGEDSHHWEC